MTAPTGEARRPRADGVRNRERLLAAAAEVFGAGGAGASLEAVARRAKLGIGTLYRHFPTREALFEAVYRREVASLVEFADMLGGEADAVAALRRWLHAVVEFVATKRGMSAALAISMQGASALMALSTEQLGGAVARLLGRAVAAGRMRGDIGAAEVLRTVVGLCYLQDGAGWKARVLVLVDVVVDGLMRDYGAG
jgi:AcrR family transcriptional regulator